MSGANRPSRQQAQDVLTGAWKECLGLESLSPDENFFEVGGNSLDAIRLLTTVRERLDARIELLDLFRYPTIRSLLDAFYPPRSAAAAPGSAGAARAARYWRRIESMRQRRRNTNG